MSDWLQQQIQYCKNILKDPKTVIHHRKSDNLERFYVKNGCNCYRLYYDDGVRPTNEGKSCESSLEFEVIHESTTIGKADDKSIKEHWNELLDLRNLLDKMQPVHERKLDSRLINATVASKRSL